MDRRTRQGAGMVALAAAILMASVLALGISLDASLVLRFLAALTAFGGFALIAYDLLRD